MVSALLGGPTAHLFAPHTLSEAREGFYGNDTSKRGPFFSRTADDSLLLLEKQFAGPYQLRGFQVRPAFADSPLELSLARRFAKLPRAAAALDAFKAALLR